MASISYHAYSISFAGVVQDCETVLQAQWLRIFRSGRALVTSADRSDALRMLRALDRAIESLIARVMRERSEALLCVAPGKPVDYFV